jgi:hypothetical protein
MKRGVLFLAVLVLFFSCKEDKKAIKKNVEAKQKQTFLMQSLPASKTHINFENQVIENDTINYFKYEEIYDGAGVAIGDINNDGLNDIFFGGNSVADRLYLNKGNMKFEDISKTSTIADKANFGWSLGVSMVDVNGDGWLDIYVCRAGGTKDVSKRANKLFINNKDNTFTESAVAYGLANTDFSRQATFFDYDKDGDLDMYLANHANPYEKSDQMPEHSRKIKAGIIKTDYFYENIAGKFVDKTRTVGISNFGFLFSPVASDINGDGNPDIYVSTDFEEADAYYQNLGNKKFKNRINKGIRHLSNSSMGLDVVDVNNDGLLDIFVLDMAPYDHVRSKIYMKSMNPQKFYNMEKYGFHSQYMQNTFQLNNGDGTFSEIAQLTGIAKTDWSWGPLFFDMDNDGYKDLFISNGIKHNFLLKDLKNILKERKKKLGRNPTLDEIHKIVPTHITPNMAFKNNGDLTFSKTGDTWFDNLNFNSNGFAYGDLDNDGDLDLVVNNMHKKASVFQNNSTNNWLKIKLKGTTKNNIIGTKVWFAYDGKQQFAELQPIRGYFSSVAPELHFGLGKMTTIPALHVRWNDGQETILKDVKANTVLTLDYATATKVKRNTQVTKPLLARINANQKGVHFKHKENKFDDYRKQVLLPHSQAQNGPFISKGDINGDGLEDFFVGGAKGQVGEMYWQNKNGTFKKQQGIWSKDVNYEDLGVLLFDADGDADLDLYVVSGGAEYPAGDKMYQDRLYINNGKGKFTKAKGALPKKYISGQAVVAADVDKDGDLDLFVGGRLIPDKYPFAAKSQLLINDGKGKFTDATFDLATDLMQKHNVTSAVFTDYDNDGDADLITVGEWTPIQIYENDKGQFKAKAIPSIKNTVGLWSSIVAQDMDADGDMDYFVGNLGLNTKFKTTHGKQFDIYVNDFDNNGSFDVVLTGKYKGKIVPSRGRQCSSEQVPEISKKFPSYKAFANAGINDIFDQKKLSGGFHAKANFTYSIYLENKGNGSFEIHQLPIKAQFAPIKDFTFIDLDKDGRKELITVGNLFPVEVETVRYDASYGAVFKFDNTIFTEIPLAKTGFATSGDSRKISIIANKILVTNNNGTIDMFEIK